MTWYGFWRNPYGRLNVGDSRASSERVVAVLIAHRTPCSDFRVDVVVIHNRTGHAPKWYLELVVADVAVLAVPDTSIALM